MISLGRSQRSGSKFLNPVPTELGGFKLLLRVIPMYISNREEVVPKRQPGPFLTDPAIYASAPQSGLRVTWMGHTSMLLEIDGFRLLIDPVWDGRASPLRWMGPKRFFPAPIPLEQLPRIDAVLVSHDHYDHLGEQTVRRLSRLEGLRDARWITSLRVGPVLQRFGVAAQLITEMDWTETVTVTAKGGSSCRLTAWPARHFSGRSMSNRMETLWSSFVIEGAKHRVYFGADTGYWEGIAEIARRYDGFDLTMLEIGAYNELWREIHLGPEGAARAFREMPAGGLLMPIHWGLFNLALHGWTQPIERLTELAEQQEIPLWSPEPGRPTEVDRGVEVRSDWWKGR